MIKPVALQQIAPSRTTSFFFPALRSDPAVVPPVWPFDSNTKALNTCPPPIPTERGRRTRFLHAHRARAIGLKTPTNTPQIAGPERLLKTHLHGSHRLVSPEQTWTRISPHLAVAGVTRCAELTHLDRLGIPVYETIRPGIQAVQATHGAGLSEIDAKVAATMAALELHHAENPPVLGKRASLRSMLADAYPAIEPILLPRFRCGYFSRDFMIDWVKAENLARDEEAWLPASSAYLCSPTLFDWSRNGLASGNHIIEATLHAFYQLIERDALSHLNADGRLDFSPERCQVIDLNTVRRKAITELHGQIRSAGMKLVLVRLRSCIPISTFLAVLLDPNPLSGRRSVHIGACAHLSDSVGAARAILKAARNRLINLHGSGESMPVDAEEKLFRFFDRMEQKANWQSPGERVAPDLFEDYRRVLKRLVQAGYSNIYRIDMTQSPFNIPVVKVLIPGLRTSSRLFA